MELTKEHFDQAVKGLATQESVNELDKAVTKIEKTVNGHTTALDTLLKVKKDKTEGNTVSSEPFSRLENWAVQVGQKLGIKLEL